MSNVRIEGFDDESYIAANPDVRSGLERGAHESALEHYLLFGIDENRTPGMKRDALELRGNVEFFAVSESGFFVLLGWLNDEGCGPARVGLNSEGFSMDFAPEEIRRFARKDVESAVREGAHDFGFCVFGYCSSKTLLKQNLNFHYEAAIGGYHTRVTPQIFSDERLLAFLLVHLSEQDSHTGREHSLYHYLAHAAGNLTALYQGQLEAKKKSPYVETFGRRPVAHSFLTVLFGSVEPILLQPILFRDAGIDFGEWIYVCNSPQDGAAALRLARLISDLYDVMITVVVMADNVGFGMANNIGVAAAHSGRVYIVNPDVYPLRSGLGELRRALARPSLGAALHGGLLFYDDQNLMHSGMFMEQDIFTARDTMSRVAGHETAPAVKLVRVEHFDKGVPFDPAQWRHPRVVPAISGAVMAFEREAFEKVGGFSSRYIFGHYEDADLSLRWNESIGPVVIDPELRFVHLEGQGSNARAPHYRAAQIINRYLFSLKYNDLFARAPELMTGVRELRAE